MLQGEHSAILSTFIKLPFFIKIFVLSIVEWPFKTGFTVAPAINYNGKSGLNVCGSFIYLVLVLLRSSLCPF